ncbi:NADH:ubiquinone oxidoreductase 17 kDa subunit [Volvox carteri f. nagariensis]|uniref:NADH:ubiquinone oxidoreductase 17 kDa subunit n=1 Tax=Volvox carteri f. nagariensis TaxID=3068 RepID=D8U388_VOLCA|nr:NADH:ubiquinone oxidoreductase 17 kDa subunit [Volvox carteri f. nagariensis]EFJ45710.1 NADH:ubiquinone oxidoreductase 17 kDa subunit [Volvox carteri f. nagariensis]|eukprot:XP_002953111.1 NADH:ubiquinone oxidoreductase 17 kDa subunit [Volvox carteri f. nagariensis]
MSNLLRGLARRAGAQLLRNPRTRGGGGEYPGGSFWSEGTQTGHNGFLFGELPPAPGQMRKALWWEPWWYIGYGGTAVGIFLIYNAKPLEAFDIKYWANPRAAEELEVEMRMLDKLNERPELKDRLVAVCKDLNLIEEEAYDLVLMRNEYKVQLGLHTGRVPEELKAIYDELEAKE